MQPRVEKPKPGNKYYINTKDGGYNPARGNPKRLNKDLTSLANCVAIYGWFNEVGQSGQVYLKSAWYPYTVITAAKREGLTITNYPTVGGIMVWTGGITGEGHVGGCAQLYDEKSYLAVESNYYGAEWVAFTRRIGDGNWRNGCAWMDKSYVFQGCIKNPFVEEQDMTIKETKALIESMFPVLFKESMAKYQNDLLLAKADDYAEQALAWAKESGIMIGDKEGNQMPQVPVKREDLACVLYSQEINKGKE